MTKTCKSVFVFALTACFVLGSVLPAQPVHKDVSASDSTLIPDLFSEEDGISCSSRDGEWDCFCPEGCCRNETSCKCCANEETH